jgi:hypothetical protein
MARLRPAMMSPETWVFSHDSIGIGTNGPTHQLGSICRSPAILNLWSATLRCERPRLQLAAANRNNLSRSSILGSW